MTHCKKNPPLFILFSFLLSALLAFSFFPFFTARAETPPEIQSDFAILIDADSGVVLYEKRSEEQAYPASTTKIMTGLLICELVENLEEEITVGSEVNSFSENNSRIGEREGEVITVKDLLYGMLLLSGNDAAATLAIRFGGSIEGFTDMMNAKARDLGLSGTHFVNPHGIHSDDHYTTAADMAKLARVAMQNELFAQVVGSPSYTMAATNKHAEARTISNTNKFISNNAEDLSYNWKPVTGIKTGFTNKAQSCLISSASQDNKNLICVLLHDSSADKTGRWVQSRALLEFGFRNLQRLSLSEITLPKYNTVIAEASKKDEQSGNLDLLIKTDSISISGLASDLADIKNDPSLIDFIPAIQNDLKAPIAQGQLCGTVTIKYQGTTIAVADLVASRSVASVESDPKNPVDSLIQSVVTPKSGLSVGALALIILLIVIALLVIMLFVRHQRAKRYYAARKRRNNQNTRSKQNDRYKRGGR